jgi:hypothetical protein
MGGGENFFFEKSLQEIQEFQNFAAVQNTPNMLYTHNGYSTL